MVLRKGVAGCERSSKALHKGTLQADRSTPIPQKNRDGGNLGGGMIVPTPPSRQRIHYMMLNCTKTKQRLEGVVGQDQDQQEKKNKNSNPKTKAGEKGEKVQVAPKRIGVNRWRFNSFYWGWGVVLNILIF